MISFLLFAFLSGSFIQDPEMPTTIVYPPYGHCMGIYRAGQEQLSMLLGGMLSFDDPQGLSAVLPDDWDTSDPGDDDELAVYGVNSGSGHIIYNASMYTLGYYGGTGSGETELSSPHGIAATTQGTVYVADTGNKRIAVLKRAGQRITPDSFISGFSEPWDVALDGRHIWVTDRLGGTLSRYLTADDPSPVVISIDRPRGVAATGFGRYDSGHDPFQVVVTGDGSTLTKLIDGETVASAGVSACGGEFFNYVEIDYHGYIWATDSIQCRIHKFDSDLNWLDSWGDGRGDADNQFMNPTGLAIWDRFGQIFIAESSGARYFWVGTDIRDLSFSSDGNGCTVSGLLTENANFIINIQSADGSLVRNLYTGRRSAGQFSFDWNGKRLQGTGVAEGEYTLRITAEPVYSSRTYFEKSWTETFHMNDTGSIQENSGGRRS